MPLAVLGDSDSHSFHDGVLLASWRVRRGGDYHPVTFQWTELLGRLRPEHVDQGAWGVWGSGRVAARVAGLLGLDPRVPRKEDYRYNFAVSGARCADLVEPGRGQAQALASLMRDDPDRWRSGVVVIRIGINDLGMDAMDDFARTGADGPARDAVEGCAEAVREAVRVVRSANEEVGIVLVGILNNSDWPRWHARWQSREEQGRIESVLDLYDDALRETARTHARTTFFDDRAWLRGLWGARGPDGRPAYRPVDLGGTRPVTLTEGDPPGNAVVADGHAHTTWNGLWVRQLVEHLNENFGAGIPEVRIDEVTRIADPTGEYGLASSRAGTSGG